MKNTPRSITVFITIFLLLFVSLIRADEKTDKVDRLFAQWDKPDSPGCTIAIIQNGKIIYKKGYGMANLELGVPLSPESVFYIGSSSKQFVAMSIALLAKRGKLSFGDDIRKYVPEMPDYGTRITIRHLIHHTCGVRDYLELLNIAGVEHFGSYHQEDALELIAQQKELNFEPGEQYLYSNSGYLLLAVIVNRASGKSLRAFAEENIFKPLGMKNSHFHDEYSRLIKNRATGYFPAGKGKYRNFISTFDCVGSGGLFSSVEDLFLWDQNFYHNKVGGKELIQQLQSTGTLNSGEKLNYAFALVIGEYKGLKTVGHGGALGGYRSGMIRFPEQNFSVICLSNFSSFNPTSLCQRMADIYLADYFKDEKDKPEPTPSEKIKFIKLSEDKLKDKVGDYIDKKTGEVRRISLKNGNLMIRFSGRNYALWAVSDTEFHAQEAPIQVIIRFERRGKGQPLLMHILPEGQKTKTYEAFQFADPTPEKLKEYQGDYFSEELNVTFQLRLKQGRLYFTHKNAPESFLTPIIQDKFNVRGFRIHFIRDTAKNLSAFTLDSGRVKNLRFNKK